MRDARARCLLATLLLLLAAGAARADDPHAHCKGLEAAVSDAPVPTGGRVDVKVVDAALVDQDGRPMRFVSDVLGDRLVVMSFIFTSCTTICPVISSRLTKLQERLGDRMGREVRLVSLSIDPRRDTPERLKAWAERHQAGPDWLHLTGQPDEVERLLRGLGVYSAAPADHAPVTLLADGRTGRWVRLNGFPTPGQLVAQLDELAAARRLAAAGRAP